LIEKCFLNPFLLGSFNQGWQYVTVRYASTVRTNFKSKVRYVGTVGFKEYVSVTGVARNFDWGEGDKMEKFRDVILVTLFG